MKKRHGSLLGWQIHNRVNLKALFTAVNCDLCGSCEGVLGRLSARVTMDTMEHSGDVRKQTALSIALAPLGPTQTQNTAYY